MKLMKTMLLPLSMVLVVNFAISLAEATPADGGTAEIRVENYDPSFYTNFQSSSGDLRIDSKLLRHVYKAKLFCIPGAGERESVYHSYLWVVIILHAAGGGALALIFVGGHIMSFLRALLPGSRKRS